jgi:DNA-binding HxlR family transcriptional regulator
MKGFDFWWEKKNATNIISCLHNLGPLMFTELAEYVGGSNSTIYNRIRELEKFDLVKIEKSTKRPFQLCIQLTKKGEKAFELLNDLICDFWDMKKGDEK